LRELEAEGGVAVSARTGEGLGTLLARVGDRLRAARAACRLRVPYERVGILSRVYARGRVLEREDRPDGIWLDVEVPRALEGLVKPYRVSGADGAGARGPARAWPVGSGTTLQEAGS
jgi:GTP-binding protein HflX